MECSDCKYRKQLALKRCKHFELGGDKKRKVCYELLFMLIIKSTFILGNLLMSTWTNHFYLLWLNFCSPKGRVFKERIEKVEL